MKTTPSQSKLHKLAQLLVRVRSGEDGAMIIFTLFMFILILWLGGMSVDLMRFETTRAKLQGTLDRATLAAADLDQTMDATDVVRDYFEKAGMLQFLKSEPVVREGLNFRVVTASAEAEMPLFFYDIPRIFTENFKPGLSTLTVGGTSTAEERVTDVEVSLVLDISSSMNSNSRMTNLRPAAREFVTTVLSNNANSTEGLVTISMVPYASVVNPGTMIADRMLFNRNHMYSSCVIFPAESYTTTELDLTQSYDHVGHWDFDEYGDNDVYTDDGWCFEGNKNAIVPFTSNEGVLHGAIANLRAYGNTSIDLGMKWGVGLLDPSTRDLVTSLVSLSGSNVPSEAAGRPYEHNADDVMKVVVLMTDGENTSQWDLYERFRSGTSFVWFDMNSNTSRALKDVNYSDTSVQYFGLASPNDFSDDRFFWNGASGAYNDQSRLWTGRFRNYPNGFANQSDYINARNAGAAPDAVPGNGPLYNNRVRNASWQDLYANWEVGMINNWLLYEAYYYEAIPYSTGWTGAPNYIYLDDYIDTDFDYSINTAVTNGATSDTRLDALCTEAKSKGVIIYAVAFEAEDAGETALASCASSPSHYFDVAGTNITDAFAAIASDIRALKLTQ